MHFYNFQVMTGIELVKEIIQIIPIIFEEEFFFALNLESRLVIKFLEICQKMIFRVLRVNRKNKYRHLICDNLREYWYIWKNKQIFKLKKKFSPIYLGE